MESIKFAWKVEYKGLANGKCIESKTFSLSHDFDGFLRMYPSGDGDKSIGHVSMFLQIRYCCTRDVLRPNIRVEYTLKAVPCGDAKPRERSATRVFEKDEGFGWDKFLATSELNDNYLDNNNEMTWHLEITSIQKIYNSN
mmetsp:Transcript_1342/g.1515  ORF Transcript_1342/g.1515 Transcript_1342/m.1515 type:complete len:140 (+) Transcript_1342:34-453(+)